MESFYECRHESWLHKAQIFLFYLSGFQLRRSTVELGCYQFNYLGAFFFYLRPESWIGISHQVVTYLHVFYVLCSLGKLCPSS
jgi:hypothetical protein